MIKFNIKYILLLIITFTFAYLQGGNLPYSIFYCVLCVFLLGLFQIIAATRFISIDTRFEKVVFVVGEKANFTMIVKNSSFFPYPFIYVQNNVLTSFERDYNGDLIDISIDQEVWVNKKIVFDSRGIYDFGAIKLRVKDMFYLFDSNLVFQSKDEIKVYPILYDIHILTSKKNSSFQKLIENKNGLENPVSTRDLRNYRDGDSLKRIHWKASAKHSELFVRNFDVVSGQESLIILDMSKANVSYDKGGMNEEKMIDFFVSLINSLYRRGIKVSILVNAHIKKAFTVENKNDFNSLIEYIIRHKSDSEDNLSSFITSNVNRVGRQKWIGIISMSLDDELSKELLHMCESGYDFSFFCNPLLIEKKWNLELMKKGGIECFDYEDLIQNATVINQ
ncbi:MAG TPA: DUF58 domain-containing protein [Clostridiaceae bacterium]